MSNITDTKKPDVGFDLSMFSGRKCKCGGVRIAFAISVSHDMFDATVSGLGIEYSNQCDTCGETYVNKANIREKIAFSHKNYLD